MTIRTVIQELAALQEQGLIQSYAIGGAVGATFYLEPVSTVDVDVFIGVQFEPGKLIADPTAIFRSLAARGHQMEGEHVVIDGWPVQFLAPGDPLTEEALDQAAEFDVEGARIKVFRPEHLAAIALRTGRAKDKIRLLQFIEQGAIAPEAFEDIVARHGLQAAWQRFKEAN